MPALKEPKGSIVVKWVKTFKTEAKKRKYNPLGKLWHAVKYQEQNLVKGRSKYNCHCSKLLTGPPKPPFVHKQRLHSRVFY